MKYIYRYGILVCCTSCANCDDGHSEQKHAQNQNYNPSKFNKKEIQDPENIKKEFLTKFNDVINNFDDKKQNSNNKSDLQDADIEKLRELDKFIREKYDDIIEIKEIQKNFDKLFFFCIHNKQEQFCNILKYLINNEYTLSGNMSSIFRSRQFETEQSNFIKNFDCEIIKLYFDHVFHQRNPKTGELEYRGNDYLQHNPDLITDVFECGNFDKVKLLVDSAPDFITSADKINSLYRPIAYKYALYYSINHALNIKKEDITTDPSILDHFLPSLNSEQTKYFFDKYPEYKVSAVGLLFYLYQNASRLNNPNDNLTEAFEIILSRFEAYDELLDLFSKNDQVKGLFKFIKSCCGNLWYLIFEDCEDKNKNFANALLTLIKKISF